MNKQTAVEWFIEELFKKIDYIQIDPRIINQAKAMEKKQIEDAYKYGNQSDVYFKAEQYYNETYKGGEQ